MEIFNEIHRSNFWHSEESVSGNGSTMRATETVRVELPRLVKQYGVKSILDIPCGDFHWFRRIKGLEGIYYVGADIVPELLASNYASHPQVDFRMLDIASSPLPKVDLVLCRDLLGHFSNIDVKRALVNLRRSGSKYLLATTFPERENSGDIQTGQWRPINLQQYFGLPTAIECVNERCDVAGFGDKSLGLWNLREEY